MDPIFNSTSTNLIAGALFFAIVLAGSIFKATRGGLAPGSENAGIGSAKESRQRLSNNSKGSHQRTGRRQDSILDLNIQ